MNKPTLKAKLKKGLIGATLGITLMGTQVQQVEATGVPTVDAVLNGMIGQENMQQIARWTATVKQYAGEVAFWQAQYKALESGNYGAMAATLGARFLGPMMNDIKQSIMAAVNPDAFFTKGGSCKEPQDGSSTENYDLCMEIRKEVAAYDTLLKTLQGQISESEAQIPIVYAKASKPDLQMAEIARLQLEMSSLNAKLSADRNTLIMAEQNHKQAIAMLQQKQKEVADAALTGDYAGYSSSKMKGMFGLTSAAK